MHQLSHASIIPSSLQPRAIFTPEQLAELVDSIKEHGIIQPLIVRKTDDNKYELIAGERRWRASGILGFSTVPAIIRKATDKDVLELALIENLQREKPESAGRGRRLYAPESGIQDEARRHRQTGGQIPRGCSQQQASDLPRPSRTCWAIPSSVGHAKVLFPEESGPADPAWPRHREQRLHRPPDGKGHSETSQSA